MRRPEVMLFGLGHIRRDLVEAVDDRLLAPRLGRHTLPPPSILATHPFGSSVCRDHAHPSTTTCERYEQDTPCLCCADSRISALSGCRVSGGRQPARIEQCLFGFL